MRALAVAAVAAVAGCTGPASNPPAEPPAVVVPPGDYPSRAGPPSLDYKPGQSVAPK